MTFVARRLAQTTKTLTSFPIQSSKLYRRGFNRPHRDQPCCVMAYTHNVKTRRCLSEGRRFLSSSPKHDKSKEISHTAKLNERGGIWIYLGWTILGLVGVDQALQYKQEREDNERRRLIAQMQLDADNDSMNVADWDETLPTLFTCKILHVDSGLDGTKMLTRSKRHRVRSGINKNIKRGDIVEIIDANVGPGKNYHLCRMKEQKSDGDGPSAVVGWYPIDYLERLD